MAVFGCILDVLLLARLLRRRNSSGDTSRPEAAEEPFPRQQNQDGHNNYPNPPGSNENLSRRKQLIRKNILTRKIRREESVRELTGLLAASRVRQAGLDPPALSQPWTELSTVNPSHDPPGSSPPQTELSTANPSHDPPGISPPQTEFFVASLSHDPPGSFPPQTESSAASLSHDPPGSSPLQTELSAANPSHDPPGSFWNDLLENRPAVVNGTIIVDEGGAVVDEDRLVDEGWITVDGRRSRSAIIVDEDGVVIGEERLIDEGWDVTVGQGGIVEAGALTAGRCRGRTAPAVPGDLISQGELFGTLVGEGGIIIDEDGVVVDKERLIDESWDGFDGAILGQGGIVDTGGLAGEGGLIAEATRTVSSADRPTSKRKTPATGALSSRRPHDVSVSIRRPEKFECAICLEAYAPGDVVAWAKGGCDHIFHEACLSAWLCDHDECPLCRRKVIHEDADVRFAGWR